MRCIDPKYGLWSADCNEVIYLTGTGNRHTVFARSAPPPSIRLSGANIHRLRGIMDIFSIPFRRYRIIFFLAVCLLGVLVACAGGSGGGNEIPLPSGFIAINGGDTYTQSRNVIISCDVENAAEMRFSNDQVAWSEWEPYATTKDWIIEAGHGIKTAYGEFRSLAGGTAIVSDTIVPLVEEKITASDPVVNAYFGGGTWGYTTNSIALSGDGTRLFAGCSTTQNKVYVFTRNSNGEWTETIINSPDSSRYSHFGQSIDCTPDASTLVIGAMGGGVGAIFIYSWSGTSYVLNKTIEQATGHDFSVNLSVSDNGARILVGTYHSNCAYLYEYSGSDWLLKETFTPGDGQSTDLYGLGVKISGDGNTVAIGAPMHNNRGAVYIYRYNGLIWSQAAKNHSPFSTREYFGRHIDVSRDGDRVVVGMRSWSFGTPIQGAAFFYEWDGLDYVVSHTFRASDNLTGADDKFGYCVSMTPDGNTVVISAPGRFTGNPYSEIGKYYIFRRSGSDWIEEQRVFPTSLLADRFFGYLISISNDGSTIAVGAPLDDSTFTDQGAVFLYY